MLSKESSTWTTISHNITTTTKKNPINQKKKYHEREQHRQAANTKKNEITKHRWNVATILLCLIEILILSLNLSL